MAARASSPRDAESVAWVYTRLALLELQAGDFKKALRASSVALGSQAGYAPALLVRSRVLLATERNDAAIDTLWAALARNPIPEYQWLLADSLRLAGRGEQAAQIEDQLKKRGAQEDPRTLALFLATRGEQTHNALRLAKLELDSRTDVFTWDAHAWALHRAGRTDEAQPAIEQALAEGTQDARLFYHAGAIAAADDRRGPR